MTTVREELIEATGVAKRKSENGEQFRERLLEAVNDLADKDFDDLSKAAQQWAQKAITHFNEKSEVLEFDDEEQEERQTEEPAEQADDSEPDEQAAESNSEEDDEDMPTTQTEERTSRRRAPPPSRSRSTSSRKAAAPARRDGQTKGKTAKGGDDPATVHLRRLLIKDWDLSKTEAISQLKRSGYTVKGGTFSTTRSGLKGAILALQDAGLLKKTLIKE